MLFEVISADSSIILAKPAMNIKFTELSLWRKERLELTFFGLYSHERKRERKGPKFASLSHNISYNSQFECRISIHTIHLETTEYSTTTTKTTTKRNEISDGNLYIEIKYCVGSLVIYFFLACLYCAFFQRIRSVKREGKTTRLKTLWRWKSLFSTSI